MESNVVSGNRKENSDHYIPALYVLASVYDITFNSHNNSHIRMELSLFQHPRKAKQLIQMNTARK